MIEPRVWKARGAVTNPSPRYDRTVAVPDRDEDPPENSPPPPATEVRPETARSILSRNESPDLGFAQSINPYRGCEHGCIYCFARPTHAYLDLSPGLDFETRIVAKTNAAPLLERELARPGYRPQVLAVGTNTDPYQPAEARLGLMRACLEVMAAFRQPVAITTKSALIARDIDLLAPMAARRLATVAISLTTLDRDLCRRLEPRAAVPAERLKTIRALAAAGIPVTAMIAPVIPVVTDHELERLLAAARAAGAIAATHIVLRLPREVKDLFGAWLQSHYPARAAHVLSRIREMRGGALDDPAFGRRFRGSGPQADLLARRMDVARRRLGLAARPPALDCGQFRVPPRPGEQMSLF